MFSDILFEEPATCSVDFVLSYFIQYFKEQKLGFSVQKRES